MSKYIKFEKDESYKGKTEKYLIRSVSLGAVLGVIKWYSGWRRYAFFPEQDTLFEAGCLEAIVNQISIMENQRRRDRK